MTQTKPDKNMSNKNLNHKPIAIFEGQTIRRHWDNDMELWYFSIIDIIYALTGSDRPRKYWNDLKLKLLKEGNEMSEKIGQLKLVAPDGKMRLTDVADTQVLLRLIQSIPSPKAEPFKLWLAQVGYERLEETADPEQAINRALKTYLKKGYSKEWINQRLKSIEIRKGLLTDEWEKRGVKEGREYAILTDEISKAWAGLTTKQYKNLKSLKKENLRDNMTNLELVLNMLAETATTEISQKKKPKGFLPSEMVARKGGQIAGSARKNIEKETGKTVITKHNNIKSLKSRKNKLLSE